MNGGCQHSCTNTFGSYICSCDPEYLHLEDNSTSVGKCLREYTSVLPWYGGECIVNTPVDIYIYYIYLRDFQHNLCCWNVSLATLLLMSLSTVRLTEHPRTQTALSTMGFNTNVCKSIAHVLKLY